MKYGVPNNPCPPPVPPRRDDLSRLEPRALSSEPALYQFPATRFVSNNIWRQWWHMASELLEIAVALLRRDYQHAATEIWNLKHSGETGHHILSGMGVDVEMAYTETLNDNIERGYYEPGIQPSKPWPRV